MPYQTRNLVRCGKTQTPSRRGRPTGEELGFVEVLESRAEQGLAPNVDVTTNREFKPSLLVASSTAKGLKNPLSNFD